MSNTWSDNEKLNEVVKLMLQEVLNLEPIKEYGGLDFEVECDGDNFNIDFGYEPAYQYDKLLIYRIENNKNRCKILKGKALGVYGSDIDITSSIYYDELYYYNDTTDKEFKKEFKDLIDRWHDKLIGCIKNKK